MYLQPVDLQLSRLVIDRPRKNDTGPGQRPEPWSLGDGGRIWTFDLRVV